MSEELPQLKKVRGRTEAPAKPPFFDDALARIGGRNSLNEPNLRVDWGWDCRIFRNNDPDALAYPGPFLDRWILQKWIPPSFFGSKKHWEQFRYQRGGDGKRIDLLGEFPSRGRYGMVMPIMVPNGEYMPLTSDVLLFIDQMWAEFSSRTLNVYSDAKLYARLQEQMELEQERLESEVVESTRDFDEYVLTHQDEINQDRAYSLPTLWTPDGEHAIH